MCDCIDLMNKALHERVPGMKLCVPFRFNRDGSTQPVERTVVETDYDGPKPKHGKGAVRLPLLFANYCPFCGARYEEPDATNSKTTTP